MLRAASYLAPNSFDVYQSVIKALARLLSVEIELYQSRFDPLNDPAFINDQLDLAFICGLPFIQYHQKNPDQFQVLVAPVMKAPRYCDRPIYFSDVVVNRSSDIHQLSELAGKTFGYNDRGSNSGYYIVQWHLAQHGYSNHFFGNWIETGSHQESLQRILAGSIDSAAIDSTVLEKSLQQHPEWKDQIRIIDIIGPSPIPPLIVANHVDSVIIHQLRDTLLNPDQCLQSAMDRAGIQQYTDQTWQDYEILVKRYQNIN